MVGWKRHADAAFARLLGILRHRTVLSAGMPCTRLLSRRQAAQHSKVFKSAPD